MERLVEDGVLMVTVFSRKESRCALYVLRLLSACGAFGPNKAQAAGQCRGLKCHMGASVFHVPMNTQIE